MSLPAVSPYSNPIAATGAGVGVFLEHPAVGGLGGGLIGILLGFWVVPGLLRDRGR